MKRIVSESESTIWSWWTPLGRAIRPQRANFKMETEDARETSRPSVVHRDHRGR
jgi:hypothetical protein